MRRMRHLKPREIQGCQLALDASIPTSLYDATSGGSLVAADGTVKRWEDQSGNGYHVTEATNGPQRKVATMNGVDTLYFDGTNDRLQQSAVAQSKFLHVAAGATVVYVAHFGTSSNPDKLMMLFGQFGSAQTGAGHGYDDRSSAGRNNQILTQVNRGSIGAAAMSSLTTSEPCTPNTPVSGTLLFDTNNANAAERFKFSINNKFADGPNVRTDTPSAADPSLVLCVGVGRGNSSEYDYYMQGYISKLAGWDGKLNASVRRRLTHADMRKWRING